MSDRLHQVTSGYSGYIRLRQFTSEGRDVELDNMLKKEDMVAAIEVEV